MSNATERAAEDSYEAQNDPDPPVTGEVTDDSYVPSSGKDSGPVPVVRDEDARRELDDNNYSAKSDAQLAQDDMSDINKSNIIPGRTRSKKPLRGSLSEGPDENDLPPEVEETGRSNIKLQR